MVIGDRGEYMQFMYNWKYDYKKISLIPRVVEMFYQIVCMCKY